MILNDGNRINSQYCIPQKNRVLAKQMIWRLTGGGAQVRKRFGGCV